MRPVELCEEKDTWMPNSKRLLCFPEAEPLGLTQSVTSESDSEVDITLSEFPCLTNVCVERFP